MVVVVTIKDDKEILILNHNIKIEFLRKRKNRTTCYVSAPKGTNVERAKQIDKKG